MTTDSIKRMGALELSQLLFLSMLWGGAFFFNAVALRGLPPLVVVDCRVGLGSLGIMVIILFSRHSVRPYLHRWRQLLILGVLNTSIPFLCIVWGQQHISSGLASIINAATPAFTILMANFFTTDERASVRKFTGAIIGLGGVTILIGTDALMGFGDHILGQLAVMGAAFSYACASTYARRLQGVPPMIVACGQLGGSALVLLPIALYVTRPWELPMPTPDVIGAVLCLGFICSTVGALLFFRILSASGATNISLVTFLIPISASALGIAFLGEPFTWRLMVGMGIICIAAVLIDGRLPLKRVGK